MSDDLAQLDADAIRAGDPAALTEVWRGLVRPLMAYLRAQGLREVEAEDIAQESFLELVRSCGEFTGSAASVRAWLFRIAYHNLLDWRRASGRRPVDLVGQAAPELVEPGPSPAELVERAIDAADVRRAIAALSADQANVITLRFLGELSAPEVAVVLGKGEGAVRALQRRAVAALGRSLGVDAVSDPMRAAPL